MRQASRNPRKALAGLAQIDAAIEAPFNQPLGQSTTAYELYLVYTGGWRFHLGPDERNTPTGKACRRIAFDAIALSGYLAELEQAARERHGQAAELAARADAVNAGPGNPFAGGSLERPGDRTGDFQVAPGIPGMGDRIGPAWTEPEA